MLRVVFILIAFSCSIEASKAQSAPPRPPSPPLHAEVLKQVDCKKLRADAQSGRTLSEVEQKQLVVDCKRQAIPFRDNGVAPPVAPPAMVW